jgi:hypothetical protein
LDFQEDDSLEEEEEEVVLIDKTQENSVAQTYKEDTLMVLAKL